MSMRNCYKMKKYTNTQFPLLDGFNYRNKKMDSNFMS